jgi:hypothetical protein
VAWDHKESSRRTAPSSRVLAGKELDLFRSCIFQLRSRPETRRHSAIFETIYKGSQASFVLRSIRFLRPDVAVVFARAHVKFKEGNQAREIETRPTMVVVKELDKWQIVAFQNTKISEIPAAAEAAARLAT